MAWPGLDRVLGLGYQGRAADREVLRIQVGSFPDQQNAVNLLERVNPFYSGGQSPIY